MDDDSEPGEFVAGVDPDDLQREGRLQPTPEQHERLKQGLHGELIADLRRAERRYLVIGRGVGEAGRRRRTVCDLLDRRRDAVAFRLEDFGFTGEELDLWAPAFEILAEMSSHVVGVLEDYDGGHVWELGYLYRYQTTVRDVLWLLKRRYDDAETARERYDNGMAASHLASLEAAVGDRVITWRDADELREAVEAIP